MKRNEIIPAAEAFIENHHCYARQWARAWTNALFKLDAGDLPESFVSFLGFTADGLTETHGVPHPIWRKFTEEKVVNFFQDFWQSLPDSPSIRGFGFGAVCDLAENTCGFDDEDEQAEHNEQADLT